MKTIGLLGGMTWESTLEYYRLLNTAVQRRLGGVHSARCVLISMDFDDIARFHRAGQWREATEVMIASGRTLKNAGAEFIVICTNLMHKTADDVRRSVGLPLLHIADCTALEIKKQGLRRVGLLGARHTMEEQFYRGRLAERHGLEVLIPEAQDMEVIHHAVYYELTRTTFRSRTRDNFRAVISRLREKGAEGIILGCTEIPLFIKQEDYEIPLFDTTAIHAEAAAAYSLGDIEIGQA